MELTGILRQPGGKTSRGPAQWQPGWSAQRQHASPGQRPRALSSPCAGGSGLTWRSSTRPRPDDADPNSDGEHEALQQARPAVAPADYLSIRWLSVGFGRRSRFPFLGRSADGLSRPGSRLCGRSQRGVGFPACSRETAPGEPCDLQLPGTDSAGRDIWQGGGWPLGARARFLAAPRGRCQAQKAVVEKSTGLAVKFCTTL